VLITTDEMQGEALFPVPDSKSTPPESSLLSRLATGAGQHLFTVNSWATQLGTTPEAQDFVEQMRKEWFPVNVPNRLCQEMMDFCRESISSHIGWPHLWAHTLRVTGTMLALVEEAQVEAENAFLMGIFHDIGKFEEMNDGDNHEDVGARLFYRTVKGHISDSLVNLMVNVIAKRASPNNPYAQLLYDADKLDKIGATGIARRVSTDWGAQHVRFALGRVRDDMTDFPRMHFPTSRHLAQDKLAYTEKFVTVARSIIL
jgi:putative nucleotidyltransferase with HDIG domain